MIHIQPPEELPYPWAAWIHARGALKLGTQESSTASVIKRWQLRETDTPPPPPPETEIPIAQKALAVADHHCHHHQHLLVFHRHHCRCHRRRPSPRPSLSVIIIILFFLVILTGRTDRMLTSVMKCCVVKNAGTKAIATSKMHRYGAQCHYSRRQQFSQHEHQ